MEKSVLQFESPKHQSAYIKVIGVGGGGTNAVNHMYDKGIEGVDFIICNTDNKSLDSSLVPTKIKLGKSGLGAGNIPAVARDRATEIGSEIKELLSHNTQMVFITAGMGGGTGTGAAPVIAELAKEIEIDDDVNRILVVAIVTLPFSFEGRRRRLQAEEGIKELRKHVDAILIINNDKLRDFGKVGLREAFSKADDILLTAAKGIAEIITVKSYINIDFRDVNTVMQKSGVALMGSGEAEGENRALKAIEMATSSALLNDNNIKGAKSILFYLASGTEEIDMDEIGEITDYIQQEVGMDVDVIWGAGFDESLGNKLSITLIATGFDSKELTLPGTVKANTPKVNENSSIENTPKVHVLESEVENIVADSKPTPVSQPDFRKEFEEPEFVVRNTNNHQVSPSDKEEPSFVIQRTTHEEETTIFVSNSEEPYIVPKINEHVQAELVKEKLESPTENDNFAPQLLTECGSFSKEDFLKAREERMKIINAKLQSQHGVEELEKEPAYKFMGIEIKEPEHSSKSDLSRFSLDGNAEIKQGNSFIYDQPD